MWLWEKEQIQNECFPCWGSWSTAWVLPEQMQKIYGIFEEGLDGQEGKNRHEDKSIKYFQSAFK